MSVYARVLAGLPPPQQGAVRGALRQWLITCGRGRRVVPNIEREQFLPEPAMLKLLDVIEQNITVSLDVLCDEYKVECRNWPLTGGQISFVTFPVLLGRAADKEPFITELWQKNPTVFASRVQALRFVERLTRRGTRISGTEAAAYMSPHAAWVTWNADQQSDPFSFATSARGDEVRANLGLKAKRKGRAFELLLLCYLCDGTFTVHKPTIADAELYEFFEPPAESETDHGYTVPWVAEEISHVPGAGDRVKPRPEGIHARQPFGIIKIPARVWI